MNFTDFIYLTSINGYYYMPNKAFKSQANRKNNNYKPQHEAQEDLWQFMGFSPTTTIAATKENTLFFEMKWRKKPTTQTSKVTRKCYSMNKANKYGCVSVVVA